MKRRNIILLIGLAVMACVLLIPACAFGYTVFQLRLGRQEGVYPSPEEGMRLRLENSYVGVQRIEIEHAGPNFLDGSIWMVIAHVWAEQRADGQPLNPSGYDSTGSFYLKVTDGWIHLPEGSLPELIGITMKVFHLEGQ